MAQAKDVLTFWFQGVTDETVIDMKKPPFNLWFTKNAQFDQDIRGQFEADWNQAAAGELKDWEKNKEDQLALIILLDQFSRNMHRGTPDMFAGDHRALALTLRAIADSADDEYELIERCFIYMPLQHAEDRAIQIMSVQCFSDLVEESKEKCPGNKSYYVYSLDYAKKHQVIIERFGRFPHRNAILGRPSTPEELEFLKKPGSSF